jgi:hypothetical protein
MERLPFISRVAAGCITVTNGTPSFGPGMHSA